MNLKADLQTENKTPILQAGATTVPFVFATPKSTFGLDWEVADFLPGRFASLIQKNGLSRHSLQVIREESASSFVMTLETSGQATVCRGWRYLSFNDGPQVHTMEHIREQLGYHGHWQQEEGWIRIDLVLDDSVCTRVEEYSHLIPNHATEWHLYGMTVVPRDRRQFDQPVLACRLLHPAPAFGEDEPHIVAGILPGPWLVLGADNGLKVKVQSEIHQGEGMPIIQMEYPSLPIVDNAWELPF